MPADLKFQLYRDDRAEPNVVDWDQRKDAGEFRGAEEGMHVKTIGEVRLSDDMADLFSNPERLQEFIQPGDSVLDIVNRAALGLKPGASLPAPIGGALPWNQVGALLYNKD